MAQELDRLMVKAVGLELDNVFLNGTGAGQPVGLVDADATVTVSKEVGQAANTVTYVNATEMLSRLAPGSFNRAVWIVHESALPQLFQLNLPIGTGGSIPAVFTESGGRYRLFGRPLVLTDRVQPLGTKGDVILADLTKYLVGIRRSITLARSNHVYYASDSVGFRATVSVDGQPTWREPYTPVNGSDTLSPFVVLETRS